MIVAPLEISQSWLSNWRVVGRDGASEKQNKTAEERATLSCSRWF